jgi:membrane protein implicated in regulation of membrane protease activity
MEWWIWLLFGLLLLLGELLTPGGFYIFFFGIGALVVGVLTGLQLAGPAWFQFILFSGRFRSYSLVISREAFAIDPCEEHPRSRQLGRRDRSGTRRISANGIGKAEARGTSWTARNLDDQALARGVRCKVEKVEGLTIFVRAEKI